MHQLHKTPYFTKRRRQPCDCQHYRQPKIQKDKLSKAVHEVTAICDLHADYFSCKGLWSTPNSFKSPLACPDMSIVPWPVIHQAIGTEPYDVIDQHARHHPPSGKQAFIIESETKWMKIINIDARNPSQDTQSTSDGHNISAMNQGSLGGDLRNIHAPSMRTATQLPSIA